jgi:hypothetical protein
MVAMLGGLLFSRLNPALGYLVKMTADLLLGAAKRSKSLLNLFDSRQSI